MGRIRKSCGNFLPATPNDLFDYTSQAHVHSDVRSQIYAGGRDDHFRAGAGSTPATRTVSFSASCFVARQFSSQKFSFTANWTIRGLTEVAKICPKFEALTSVTGLAN